MHAHIHVYVRTYARSIVYLYTRTQLAQTNGLTMRSSSIWREDSRSGGSRADLDWWDDAQGARSWAGARAEPAVRRWVRERKMRLGWNQPAAVVPLDPEQALDLTVYIYIYIHVRTYARAHARTHTHVRARGRS